MGGIPRTALAEPRPASAMSLLVRLSHPVRDAHQDNKCRGDVQFVTTQKRMTMETAVNEGATTGVTFTEMSGVWQVRCSHRSLKLLPTVEPMAYPMRVPATTSENQCTLDRS